MAELWILVFIKRFGILKVGLVLFGGYMFRNLLSYKKNIIATVVLFMMSGCSNDQTTNIENGLRGPVVISEKSQTMNLEERMRHYNVPAVSIAVIKDSSIDFVKAFGKDVDQNTLFQAGSTSKTLNAFGILTLVQQGKVNLDVDVNQYLKNWKIKHNEYYKETDKITLRQILSHSAGFSVPGFPGYEINKKLPSTLEVLNGTPDVVNTKPVEVIYNPGEKFQYSGGGTTVSQLVLEDVTGEDYADWMRKNVLEPLGMRDSTFKQPLPSELQSKATEGHDAEGNAIAGKYHVYPEKAAAGLWTTPTDLAKFVIAMFNIADGNHDYPISKKLQDEMLNKQIKGEGYFSKWYSGLGAFLEGDGNNFSFGHEGRNKGFISRMVAYPKLKKGFIIMVNNYAAFNFMDEITNGIADTYNMPGFKKVNKESVKYSLGDYPDILGTYKNKEYTLDIISKENTLFLYDPNLKTKKRLYLKNNQRFFFLEDAIEIEYLQDEKQINIHSQDDDDIDKLVKVNND